MRCSDLPLVLIMERLLQNNGQALRRLLFTLPADCWKHRKNQLLQQGMLKLQEEISAEVLLLIQ